MTTDPQIWVRCERAPSGARPEVGDVVRFHFNGRRRVGQVVEVKRARAWVEFSTPFGVHRTRRAWRPVEDLERRLGDEVSEALRATTDAALRRSMRGH